MGKKKSRKSDDSAQKKIENSSETVDLKDKANGESVAENVVETVTEKKDNNSVAKDVENHDRGNQGEKRVEAVDLIYEKQYGRCLFMEIEGDLFDSPEDYALAHGVAKDLRMSVGIAAEFRKRFENMNELVNQSKNIGEMAILNVNGRRFIYYLIIKEFTYDLPTIESVKLCIEQLHKHCKDNGIKKLAIPPIGLGRDRLEWNEVKDVLTSVFEDLEIEIRVYKFSKILLSRRGDRTGENYGRRPPRFNNNNNRPPSVRNSYGANQFDGDNGPPRGGFNGSSAAPARGGGDNGSSAPPVRGGGGDNGYSRGRDNGYLRGGGGNSGGRWRSNDSYQQQGGYRGSGYNDDAGDGYDVGNVSIPTRVFVNSKLKKKYTNANNDRRNTYDEGRD